MDFEILYALGLMAFVLVVCFVVVKKVKISKQDLETVKSLFNLSVAVIDDLNLKSEKRILEISGIINTAVDLTIAFSDSVEDVNAEAYKYTSKLCGQMKIEITPQREAIIKSLIDIAVKQAKQIQS